MRRRDALGITTVESPLRVSQPSAKSLATVSAARSVAGASDRFNQHGSTPDLQRTALCSCRVFWNSRTCSFTTCWGHSDWAQLLSIFVAAIRDPRTALPQESPGVATSHHEMNSKRTPQTRKGNIFDRRHAQNSFRDGHVRPQSDDAHSEASARVAPPRA